MKNNIPAFEEFLRTADGYRAINETGIFRIDAWEKETVWTWCIHGNDGNYMSNFDGVAEYEENLDSPTCNPSAKKAYEAMKLAYKSGFSI